MSLRADQLGIPLKILRRLQETPESVSLVLEIPPNLKKQFHYQAGQFVTFFLNVNGEMLNRSYSLSSAPGVDEEFKVTIKKVPGGRASTYLCERVKEGDSLLTAPPAGAFFKPTHDAKGGHYFLIAAGSGITPIFSILKSVLMESPLNKVTLVFCNRNEQSIIYRTELEAWASRFPSQLNLIHILSKPTSPNWTGHRGRLNRNLLQELVEQPRTTPAREFYLCGPTEFMQTARQVLHESGISREHIRIEDFAVALHKPKVEVDAAWTFIGADTPAETPETIVAEINGETVEVPAKPGQSILETLLEAGHQPPYSCMDGACMACLAKIQSGRVYQVDPGILTDENIKAGEMLTCQAKPLSRIVKVTFDSL